MAALEAFGFTLPPHLYSARRGQLQWLRFSVLTPGGSIQSLRRRGNHSGHVPSREQRLDVFAASRVSPGEIVSVRRHRCLREYSRIRHGCTTALKFANELYIDIVKPLNADAPLAASNCTSSNEMRMTVPVTISASTLHRAHLCHSLEVPAIYTPNGHDASRSTPVVHHKGESR